MKNKLPLIVFCFYFFLFFCLIFVSIVTDEGKKGLIRADMIQSVSAWVQIGFVILFFVGIGFIILVSVCYLCKIGIYNPDFDGGKG